MNVRHHVDHDRPSHPSRPLRRHRLCVALGAALTCAATLPAAADEIVWNGSQSQDWFNGDNWTPAAPPAPDDDAVIDTNQPNGPAVIGAAALLRDLTVGRSGSVTLQIAGVGGMSSRVGRIGEREGSAGAVVVAGAGSVWNNSQALFVGLGGAGSLNVFNGGEVFSGSGSVGQLQGSDGSALISGPGSTWTNAGALIVGDDGAGTLFVINGATATNGQARVGQGASGQGAVLVSGAGSTWTSSGLVVGNSGTGSLEILDGGAVVSNSGTVGNLTGSVGEVVVEGPGSHWSMAADLSIGAQGGAGTLHIQDGGAVASDAGNLGVFGGSGNATLTGPGSNWIMTGDLIVGRGGNGVLDIRAGSAVNNANAWLGDLEGSDGAATVSGLFSLWNNAGNLVVGNEGTGTLDITDRGTVINSLATIGAFATGAGVVTVDGAGSTWNIGSNLFVGSAGSGSLVVSDGGQVDNAQGNVGLLHGSEGAVLVTGAGSTWSNASSIRVAQAGTGTVRVEDGGSLTSAGGVLAQQVNAEGAVTVHGAGSTWLNSADLFVGWNGTGTLAIEAGGAAVNSSAYIGFGAGSHGAVAVDGPGSTWATMGPLTVADEGAGSLAVASGGLVTSGSGMIGRAGEADGIVRLDGAGTHWGIGTTLAIGGEGAGTLEISGGATILQIGGNGNVGDSASGSGEVLVTGAGSRWDSSGSLFVGRAGTGSLAVLDGAQVSNVGGAVGASAGAEGTVLVSGADSLWTSSAQFAVGGSGTGTLTIAGGGAVQGEVMILGASASGDGHAAVTGAGSLWQTQSSLIVGSSGHGTLTIEDGGAVATDSFAWVGSQAGSQGTVIVRGAGSLWNPDSFITLGRGGAGTLTVAGDGAVITGGAIFLAQQADSSGTLNFGAGADGQAAAPGTLQASTIAFGDGEATLNFNHNQTDYGFLTPMTSVGAGDHAIAHLAGTTILGGDSAGFSGTTTVSGGTLVVESILGGMLLVEANGTLAGTGAVGTTTVAAGGTLAPGASIGTLAVDGDVTFLPGSMFAIELDMAGNSDLLAVAGAATLDGGAVAALPLHGIAINTPYTILTAGGGVTGAFDSLTLDSPSAFLSPTLAYQPNAVLLELVQGASFASVALTPNQAAAGGGADSLGNGHPVWDAVVVLGEDDARDAFDALSGEIHASTLGALVDESRYIRDATNARLHAAADADARGFWLRGLGASGRIDGDGNADRVERSVGGVFLGGDVPVGDGWRLGAALGHHRSSLDVDGRRSSADVESTHLGAYAGRHWGASALRLGAAWTRHDIDAERRADFNGYSEQLRSGYDASTLQLHGEYGYALDRGNLAWEPFAGLAWVQVDADDFSEGAGPAALAGAGGRHDATWATAGVRLAHDFGAGRDVPATLRGMLGWQRSFGDTVPRVRSAFAGGDAFIVAGAPVAGNAALVDVGVDFALGNSTRLGVWYGGRFGSDVRENAARVVFATAF